jgi:hypothetical protein
MAVQDTFGLDLKWAKNNFFDRRVVLDRAQRAERRVLSRAGAFIRTRSRSSIKRRKGISIPGKPPHAHVKGTDGIKKILFAYDARAHSVVVGPVLFRSRGATTVPRLLERGGRVQVDVRRGRARRTRRVNQRYLARPFMNPAMLAEAPKFPQLWKGAVR